MLHHLINLHTHLLVHFSPNQSIINEQSSKEKEQSEDYDEKDCFPQTTGRVVAEDLLPVGYGETVALFGRALQRLADHLEDVGGAEQTVEIATVN